MEKLFTPLPEEFSPRLIALWADIQRYISGPYHSPRCRHVHPAVFQQPIFISTNHVPRTFMSVLKIH